MKARGLDEDATGPGTSRASAATRTALKLTAVALIAITAANCAGPQVAARKGGSNKYGVKASPRVIPEGQPIPKGGGREMVGQPYVVGGRTYVPHNGKGYNREGWASWYGTAFHGRLTANGEVFDRESVAAAHPTLPLPSYVRVTNVVNKRSMVVRVNDRGPYERDRLIDVSERVAEALDFRRKGVTRVEVEYLGKASTNGSDDEKLLATLRTDGTSAPFGRHRAPTMHADLRHAPPQRAALAPVETAHGSNAPAGPAREQRMAEAAAETVGPEPTYAQPRPVRVAVEPPAMSDDDGVPLPPTRPTVSRQIADAAEPQSRVSAPPLPAVNLLPPQRPIYAGIY